MKHSDSFDWNSYYASFPYVKCTTTSGYTWKTSVSKQTTKEDAERYFLGQYFDVAAYPEERMEKVVRVDYCAPVN